VFVTQLFEEIVHIDLVCLVIVEARSVWRGLEYLMCYLSATLFLSLLVSNFMNFGHAANNSDHRIAQF
jgi:hypothetical protein